jgi:hypothetical protein
MTAATKTRHLAAVPDEPAPAAPSDVEVARFYVEQQATLTEQHQAAHLALEAPDVEQDLLDAVNRTARALEQPGANRHALLADLARRMYWHGHVDGAADRKAGERHLKIADSVLAEVVVLEQRDRQALRATEHTIKRGTVKP